MTENSKLTVHTVVVATAVYHKGESPIFGECSTLVCVEDEGAGAFISLKQFRPKAKSGEVRLDIEELQAALIVAEKMLADMPEDE